MKHPFFFSFLEPYIKSTHQKQVFRLNTRRSCVSGRGGGGVKTDMESDLLEPKTKAALRLAPAARICSRDPGRGQRMESQF